MPSDFDATATLNNLYMFLNGPSFTLEKEFTTTFKHWHPAIQQMFFDRLVVPACKVLNEPYMIDPRNRRAGKIAKAVEEVLS